MKYIRQFLIILAVTFLGEALSLLIPLPIPGGIYGLILMFAGLVTKIIPHEKVRDTGHFLVEIMPVMFIPPAVGLIDSWGIIRSSWLQYLVIIVVTTVLVMAAAGRVTQFFIRKGGEKDV